VAKAQTKKIGIVGSGGVGSAVASSLIHKNIVTDIYMNDMNSEVCRGVVLDLEDEAFITGTRIHHTLNVRELKHCDIIVITAGAKQRPDEPRTELIERNAFVLKSIISSLLPVKEDAILLVVSNPVDVLTCIVQECCSGMIPRSQIIGSGTYLDTQRARVAISKEIGVSVKSVHAYILGEHGDSQVFARSISRVGGSPLTNFKELTPEALDRIENEAKRKAYEIIKRKGATSHGIGECVASICETIILNKNEVMSVSSYHPVYETCLGWPAVVGSHGVLRVMPLDLHREDEYRIAQSAKVIKSIATDIVDKVKS
jgi:L-lactate dehydrogenase